jgi:hypothetical protein
VDELTSAITLKQNFEKSLEQDIKALHGAEGHQKLQEANMAARKLIKPKEGQAKGQIAKYVARELVRSKLIPGFVSTLAAQIKTCRLMIPNFDDEIPF